MSKRTLRIGLRKCHWKLVLALGAAFTLIACYFAFLAPTEPDGLDWIRKYNPTTEKVLEEPTRTGDYIPMKTKWLQHEFVFKNGIPQGLLDEDLARLEKMISDMDKKLPTSDDSVDVFPEKNLVVVNRPVDRSWIDQQWRKFRRSIGLLPLKQP